MCKNSTIHVKRLVISGKYQVTISSDKSRQNSESLPAVTGLISQSWGELRWASVVVVRGRSGDVCSVICVAVTSSGSLCIMSITRRLPLCVTVMCLALSSFPHIAASLFPHKPTLTSPLCLSNTHTDPEAKTLNDQQINQTLERLLSSSASHLFKWSRWLCVVTAEGFTHCHACWSLFIFYFFADFH